MQSYHQWVPELLSWSEMLSLCRGDESLGNLGSEDRLPTCFDLVSSQVYDDVTLI